MSGDAFRPIQKIDHVDAGFAAGASSFSRHGSPRCLSCATAWSATPSPVPYLLVRPAESGAFFAATHRPPANQKARREARLLDGKTLGLGAVRDSPSGYQCASACFAVPADKARRRAHRRFHRRWLQYHRPRSKPSIRSMPAITAKIISRINQPTLTLPSSRILQRALSANAKNV